MLSKARRPNEGQAAGDVPFEPGPKRARYIESVVDRAVERSFAEFGTGDVSLRPWFTQLRHSIVDAINGRPPSILEIPGELPIDDILQLVRQDFLRDMQERAQLSPWDGIRCLSALARLQSLYDRAVAQRVEHKTLEGALGPVVEVAHDMRSPLSAVLFLIATLRSGRSGPITRVQEQQLRLMHSSVLGLNQLACDLIDYFRGTERFADDSEIAFSITGLLNQVSDIVHPMAEEKGIAVELISTKHDTRRGRPTLISRVLLNLASNAIRYADRGAVIVSACESTPGRVRFSVSDSGRTIPQDLLPHLFEAFRPALEQPKGCFSSSGLGLAICHRLVTSLGGELRVESSPNGGTRFSFEIALPDA
jgi:signal transduction histidine kinase